MKFLYFLILISLTPTATPAGVYSMPGCKNMCGNVQIPYPFGIGTGCSLDKRYAVDCNSSRPYLSMLNNVEVLFFSLEDQTMTINVSMTTDCRNPVRNSSQILGVDLDGSPFLFSRTNNIFMADGCGNAFISEQGNLLTGCFTSCRNISTDQRNNCFGINCCQTMIPHHLKTYSVDVTNLQSQGGVGCGSAFLVDGNYSAGHGRFFGQSTLVNHSFIPVTLLWTLGRRLLYSGGNTVWSAQALDLGNGTTMETYRYSCSSMLDEGNPYLSNGCQEVEECATCEAEGKSVCRFNGIGNFTCDPNPHTSSKSSVLGVILGVSITLVVLILMPTSCICALYKVIKKAKAKRRRERFFKHNGGLLLKQQESADEGLVDKTTLFTARELEKATDYFNENRILGRGGQGTVYKGMLTDGRIVAVKKSKIVDESQLEQFINEVVVLTQVNHRNVVRLLGCCLETEVPLLVSEFIPNGTLYECIHDESDEFPLTLNARLRIATEVAGALAYLHSATSIPIYHRDIKSTNILLDDKYRAKVSDFGTSRFVSIDQSHLTTLVKGTFGYLDPEYFQSSQFTEKSDVYSFGVVLVELLTSEKPISLTRFGEHRNLATHFMLAMEEGQVMSIIDAKIIKEGSRGELMEIANLAMQCLDLNGKNRPTMKEVAYVLESIRTAHIPSVV